MSAKKERGLAVDQLNVTVIKRGRERIPAIAIPCNNGTVLYRPVPEAMRANARIAYEKGMDKVIGKLPPIVKQLPDRVPATAPATKFAFVKEICPGVNLVRPLPAAKPVKVVRRSGGYKVECSQETYGNRKSAQIKYGSLYKSNWYADNCWKTHRDTQYR